MNMLTMIMGLLIGLVAPILLGVAMAAAKIISIGRDALTIKKAPRKTSTTGSGVGDLVGCVCWSTARKAG